jgi:nucleoside-diphosphate-sugar epimerase
MKHSFIQPWMIDLADDHYELDISLAKRLLDWTPKHRLEETIPRWVKELKEDPIQWYDENKLRRSKHLTQKAA